MTKIALGMTVYNGERTLGSTLDSVLMQSYAAFELFIYDDGSEDASPQLVAEAAERDRRVTVVQPPEGAARLGLARAWAHVLEVALREGTFEYFAWVSDHDVLDQRWLEFHMRSLEDACDVAMVYSSPMIIHSDQELIHLRTSRNEVSSTYIDVSRIQGAGDMIYGVFRSAVLKEFGGFPNCLLPDRVLLERISAKYAFRRLLHSFWYRREPVVSMPYEKVLLRQYERWFLISRNVCVTVNQPRIHKLYRGLHNLRSRFYLLAGINIIMSLLNLAARYTVTGNFKNAIRAGRNALSFAYRKKRFIFLEIKLFLLSFNHSGE